MCEFSGNQRPGRVHNFAGFAPQTKNKTLTGNAKENPEKAFVPSAGRHWDTMATAETPLGPIYSISPVKQKL